MMVARHLCSTPNEEAWRFQMCKNPELVRKVMCQERFEMDSTELAEFDNLRLPRHPGNILKKKGQTRGQRHKESC